MSYKDQSKSKRELKQRVADLEHDSVVLRGYLQEVGSQAHWMLTILKDMPEWNGAVERAKEVVENAKKLKEESNEEAKVEKVQDEHSGGKENKVEEKKEALDLD